MIHTGNAPGILGGSPTAADRKFADAASAPEKKLEEPARRSTPCDATPEIRLTPPKVAGSSRKMIRYYQRFRMVGQSVIHRGFYPQRSFRSPTWFTVWDQASRVGIQNFTPKGY